MQSQINSIKPKFHVAKTTFSRATPQERKRALDERWQDLKRKRAPWLAQWEEVSRFVAPQAGRFNEHNHGEDRDFDFILDSEATRDLNILASGLMSGASSPARPWFSLAPKDENLQDNHEVAVWCAEVQKIILNIFAVSNTYNTLHQMYRELALFGIAADIIYDDWKTGICHHPLTAGEFCVATNHNGAIDTIYRDFELTVAQAVKAFGYERLSKEIQICFDRGQLGEYFQFVHAIEPREDRDLNNLELNTNFPFASYYFEVGTSATGLVSESGFKEFPCVCPRWDILGIDPYGSSPSIVCLPDIRQLQQETLRKAELIDQYSKPPLQVPNNARQNPVSLQAGALNFTMGTEQQIRPILNGSGDLNSLNASIAELKQAIQRGYYVDLFMMVKNTAGDRRTTVEINALQQEQMLTLGSVVERNQVECLQRLVEIVYHRLFEAGALPEPPQALADSQLDISFQSVLASAQKAVDVNTIDRMFQAISASAQVVPEVLDRIDPDGLVDEYSQRLGVAPKILRSVEDAQAIRQQRAQAQQAQMEQAQQAQQAQMVEQYSNALRNGAQASEAAQGLEEVAGGMPY